MDWREWGCWWGQALSSIGADMASLVETRFPSMQACRQACIGLSQLGWKAVGHCKEVRGSVASVDSDYRSAGVVIAVRDT